MRAACALPGAFVGQIRAIREQIAIAIDLPTDSSRVPDSAAPRYHARSSRHSVLGKSSRARPVTANEHNVLWAWVQRHRAYSRTLWIEPGTRSSIRAMALVDRPPFQCSHSTFFCSPVNLAFLTDVILASLSGLLHRPEGVANDPIESTDPLHFFFQRRKRNRSKENAYKRHFGSGPPRAASGKFLARK